MRKNQKSRSFKYLPIWAVVLGIVGFVFGFCGPILLNPEANQGPLFGIFFTGPGALIFGILVGLICSACAISPRLQFYGIICASTLVGVLILYWSLPENRYIGFIIDAEVRGCKKTENLIRERVEWWQKTISESRWIKPEFGWENNISTTLKKDNGVILDMFVYRKREFYQGNKPWNKGVTIALPWKRTETNEKFYSRFNENSCAVYNIGERSLFFPEWEVSEVSPPDNLPSFLGLYVLNNVPIELQTIIEDKTANKTLN